MKHSRLLLTLLLALNCAAAPLALADVGALNMQVVQLHQQGKYIEALELAQKALVEAESTFGATHPKTAKSLNNLATLLEKLGRYDEALPLYQRALTIREVELGPMHPDTAQSLNNLAALLQKLEQYDEALPLHRRALAICEATLGPMHPETATCLNNLATLLEKLSRYDEALPLHQRALAIRESILSPTHPDTAISLNNLAVLLENQGRHDEALPLLQRALTICEVELGPMHLDTAQSLNNLALLLHDLGQYNKAWPLLQRTLVINEAALGPMHPKTATSLNNLALLFQKLGRYGEAFPLHQRALAIHEAALGPAHPDTAQSLNNLALLLQKLGRYGEALPLHQRALAIHEAALGPAHPNTAIGLNNLAGLLESLGRYDEGFHLYQRALAIREPVLGPMHPETATSLNNLALLLEKLGRYDEALPLLQRALAVHEAALGPAHPNTANSLNNLAGLLKNLGRHDEALPLYQRALAICETALGPAHPNTAISLDSLAGLLENLGRYDEALPLFRRALAIREAALGPAHPETTISLNNLAELLEKLGRYDEALPLFRRALAIREAALGPAHPETATSLNNLAGLLEKLGRYDEALPLLQRALAIHEAALGPTHPDTAQSLNNLAVLLDNLGRHDEALPLHQRALAIRKATLGPAHPDAATSMHNLAIQLQNLDRYNEALPLLQQAMQIILAEDITDMQRQYGNLEQQAVFSADLASTLYQQTPSNEAIIDQAIFYYKLSINARQRLRAGVRKLDTETRLTFTQKWEHAYQQLAKLLIQRGRLAEAEQVLFLLKESELVEYLRRNGSSGGGQLAGLNWTDQEKQLYDIWQEIAKRWREFDQHSRQVMVQVKGLSASSGQAKLTELHKQRDSLDKQIQNQLDEANATFAKHSDRLKNLNVQRQQALGLAQTALSQTLANLAENLDEPRTAGLLLLPSERGLTLVVSTEHGAIPLIHEVSEGELMRAVQALRDAIINKKNYREPAQALYQHLIAPAEAQLGPDAGIQQWAILPFGVLRAIPFAALMRPDGAHLIEHYSIVMLTADGTGRLDGLEIPSQPNWRGVALGATQPDPAFNYTALPGVQREVCRVIRAKASQGCHDKEGVIAGSRYLDKQFTSDLFQLLLSSDSKKLGPYSKRANFLHIATHFNLNTSELLLGDGSKLTTKEILRWQPYLSQYDLIALSACDSGMEKNLNENNVESLAGVLRANGAKAVLATLWPVEDVGAAPLMVEFYRQRGEKRAMSKAAALRQAQLAMLKGRLNNAQQGKIDLRHPYFWAPYSLMGNWL